MPKAVAVTYGDYRKLRGTLLSKRPPKNDEAKQLRFNFREMSRREMRDEVIAHGLRTHKKSTEAEKGFVYSQKGLMVKVWTSCERSKVDDCDDRYNNYPLLREGILQEVVSREKGTDMGWVLIVDSRNQARYFAVPFHRTLNFVQSICEWARISQMKVQGRPLCAVCECYMDIRVEESRATYWACFHQASKHRTQKPVFLDWDAPIAHSLAAGVVVSRRRKKRLSWQKKKLQLRDEGKQVPRSARKIRGGWRATKQPYANAV